MVPIETAIQDEACPQSPEVAPLEEWESSSSGSLSIVEGPAVNVWSDTLVEESTDGELKVQLQPNQLMVIGRQEGGEIEYLDPQYRPTRVTPNGTCPILLQSPDDNYVSRGHFTLKASPFGLLFVNGVPRRGGGIRPPKNGTLMLSPVYRWMHEGEEYVIEYGASAKIRLPNKSVILLRAE